MSVIESGKKRDYEGPMGDDVKCIECGNPCVYLDHEKEKRLTSGGYHLGDTEVFLCSRCGGYGDLHVLGYIIGDAILASFPRSFYPNGPNLNGRINTALKALEASVFRAVSNQLEFRLKRIQREGL